jgi:hypothetical protein
MAASAKSLQNIPETGIFSPGASEVNVGDASAALADADLDEDPIYAKPAHNRAAQLPERRSNVGSGFQVSPRYEAPSRPDAQHGRCQAASGRGGRQPERQYLTPCGRCPQAPG